MKIKDTFIRGLKVIEYDKFEDLRGQLYKPFTSKKYKENNIQNLNFQEVWFTRSKKDVIRGMHYQGGKMKCEKLVSCVKGKVLDVVLDLRKNSETYGEYFSLKLSENKLTALYIPVNCAHGYRVLENDSMVMYMATEIHSPENDIGVRWDSFGFDWDIKNPILSERDKKLPCLKESMI